MKDPAVQLIDLRTQVQGIQIRCILLMQRSPRRLQIIGQLKIIVMYHLARRGLHNCRNCWTSAIIRISRLVSFAQIADTQNRVLSALIQREGPVGMGKIRPERVNCAQTDGLFKSQQAPHDHSAVRPGAGCGPD
ncbi:hypothetical protein D3C75_798860 [compost metagenome]